MVKLSNLKLFYVSNRYPIVLKILNVLLNPLFSIIRRLYRSSDPRRVNLVVISLHKLGDSIFTIPAIREIVKRYKQNIYLVCFYETKKIFEEVLPDLHYVCLEASDFYLSGRIASGKARKTLRQVKPRTVFDLTSSIKSSSLIFNIKAEEIVGANDKHYKNIYTHFVPVRKEPHIMDIYLDIVKAKIPIHDSNNLKSFPLNITKKSRIAIHPFAGWKSKEWNLRKYLELAKKLQKEFTVTIIVPVNTLSTEIKGYFRENHMTFIETKTIEDLISQIRNCTVMVGNDSGPIYMANLLGKATFTIFGPTNPEFHLPFGDYHGFIRKEIKCVPIKDHKLCFTNGGRLGCPSFECMNQLSVESVYEKLLIFLKKIEQKPTS